jgi:hypothetical protein
MLKSFLPIIFLTSLIPQFAFSIPFANQFVQFEKPSDKWQCALEGAEWICQNTDETSKKDAIIVFAAKLKGDQDTLDKYQEYLNKPRSTQVQGKTLTSQPKYTKVTEINQHPWVDSLHFESEIPGYYTRYLATVKEDIGVLVTYSILKEKYQDYLNDFESMVKSLKVFRKAGGINTNTAKSIFETTTVPGSFTASNLFQDTEGKTASAPQAKKKTEANDSTLYLILLLAGAVGFIIWKKKKSGN